MRAGPRAIELCARAPRVCGRARLGSVISIDQAAWAEGGTTSTGTRECEHSHELSDPSPTNAISPRFHAPMPRDPCKHFIYLFLLETFLGPV